MSLIETQRGRETPLPKSMVQRAIEGARYVISGVTPQTWFGPSQPIPPMAPADAAGRAFDYPFGFNLNYTPRSYEPIGFSDLRTLADNCDIVRLLIETRKDQVESRRYDIRPRKLPTGEHPKASEFAAQITAANDFFAYPDKDHDFAQWTRMLGEDLFVIDAPALYRRLDRKGRIYAFEVVDGATIAPRIDANGRTPLAPDVAYQQILHGVPAADYSTDELIYYPRNRRPHKIYGYSPVEQIVLTINVILRRTMHQLAYYTEGNLTDAMFTAPQDWTKDQIEAWQKYWNSLFSGNVMARRQGVWVPSGTDVKQPKPPILKDSFDDLLLRVASFAFSISAQWAVSNYNRATAETAQEQAEDEGLAPVLNWYKRLNDRILRALGYPQLEFVWDEDTENDPAVSAKIDQDDVGNGIRTINQVLVSRGLQPSADPAADVLMVRTPTGYVPIDAALKVLAESVPEQPGNLPAAAETVPGDVAGDNAPKPEKMVRKSDPAVRDLTADMLLNRPVSRAARQTLTDRYAKALADTGKAIADALRKSVAKAAGDNGAPNDEDQERLIETVEAFRLEYLDEAAKDSTDDLSATAADAGHAAVLRVGISGDDVFNQVNERAVSWADDRVAELVMQIDESTRNMLREAMAKAMADGDTAEQIADTIAEIGAFSPERAAFIAETEIANANGAGALAGLKEAAQTGLDIRKRWLLSSDPCPICVANAAEGAIPLDEPFLSGAEAPLAHPNCRCALGHEIVEGKS